MQQLQTTVQNNCNLSDAQYAGNYTLCIYLLKMREYFRWETGQAFGEPLSRDDIGEWLTKREHLWDGLENQDYTTLNINNQKFDPFQTRDINKQLNSQGLVYSGGYGNMGKPVFFLAEIESMKELDDYTIYISSRELARDLAAPPGMAQDKCVYIRRESLSRFLWEKFEESDWYNDENPLARALACYDFKKHPDESLERMTDAEIDTILHHEIGEILAGQRLGDDWEAMLASLPHSQAELLVRSIRDNLADSLSTLPRLLEDAEPARIHFYFANMSNLRKVIFPSIMSAYQEWLKHGDKSPLTKLLNKSEKHWTNLAQQCLKLFNKHGDNSAPHIESTIKNHYL